MSGFLALVTDDNIVDNRMDLVPIIYYYRGELIDSLIGKSQDSLLKGIISTHNDELITTIKRNCILNSTFSVQLLDLMLNNKSVIKVPLRVLKNENKLRKEVEK